MFAKPEWFRLRKCGFRLSPITFQGWLYVICWIAVICLPFWGLLLRGLAIESLVWAIAALGLLSWELRQVIRQLRHRAAADVLYIGDEDPPADDVTTGKYSLKSRNHA
jgi:hypothetical protein